MKIIGRFARTTTINGLPYYNVIILNHIIDMPIPQDLWSSCFHKSNSGCHGCQIQLGTGRHGCGWWEEELDTKRSVSLGPSQRPCPEEREEAKSDAQSPRQ
jgi:hypothetical protein